MDDQSRNAVKSASVENEALRVVCPHRWYLLLQSGVVNSGVSPASQGYKVFDEAAHLPEGNMPTRWAITTSEVTLHSSASSSVTVAAAPIGTVARARVPGARSVARTRHYLRGRRVAPASPAAPIDLNLKSSAWTDAQKLELVELRAVGTSYHDIEVALRRTKKSCEMKFDRIKKEPEYQTILDNAGYNTKGDDEDL